MNKKLLFSIPLVAVFLTGCVGTKTHRPAEYCLETKWDNVDQDFRVLQLCDIHFSQADIVDQHMAVINKTIEKANANFIVLNGDSFTYADKRVVNYLFSEIDKRNIPWTFTFGNHDDQGYFPDTYIERLLSSGTYKNCLFVNIEDDDVTGRSNFVVNIKQGDTTKYQIICMESHSYNFDTMEYDFIKEDQIAWYEKMINYSKTYCDNAPSLLYFHIPTPEFFTAWHDFEDGKTNVEKILGTTQEFGGGPLPSSDTKIFDKVKELGLTKAISCAHDHINDSVLKYNDVYLCFGVHATNRIYFDENMIGGQVIGINHETQELSFKNIYTSYEEVEAK